MHTSGAFLQGVAGDSSLDAYHALIAAKRVAAEPAGFADIGSADILPGLFPHQEHCLEFALRAGRAAGFLDTGLGKTAMGLGWGNAIVRRTNRPVLMLAPLAVAAQHQAEAERIGVEAKLSRFGIAPERPCIAITNYERLERFDPADYAAVILDESSILKSFTGKTKQALVRTFAGTPYRLCLTATPAPNDHTELGQHSEFLGVMRPPEMLSRWFIADQANAGKYRLKRPAVRSFWDWVASWARCVSKPSDLGFSDDGFVMPKLHVHRHLIEADRSIDPGEEKNGQGRLFRIPSASATSIHKEKRMTAQARAKLCSEIVFGDWSCPGSQNTPSDVALEQRPIPIIGQSATRKETDLTARSDESTTSNGTTPIKNASLKLAIKTPESEIESGANDTFKTKHSGKKQKSQRSSAAQTREETPDCELNTGSAASNTIDFLNSSTADAQSVQSHSVAGPVSVSPSITAIAPARCAVSSAPTAIRGSASSATMPNSSDGQQNTSTGRDWWVIWCDTDYEQDELERVFGDAAISIRGSMPPDRKEELHEAWIRGDCKIIICKPVMFGFGLNWQHCCKMVFCGLSFSYESFYQAVRRCWRFRQTREVHAHVVCADTEASIWDVVNRKAGDHSAMKAAMSAAMARAAQSHRVLETYDPQQGARLPAWMVP